ncbi:uncharacterized protein [Linepithema humile]|uniref:uncharacterized protein isoform X2 n=1 Tax=Linepithema humile TaxID=83485 RepID=UPI00351E7C96
MNLYISTFHHQAAILMERGVDIIVHATGEIINFKVYSALCWCYIKGKHDGTTMRYPISQMTDPPLRTHEKYILDVQTAVRCKKVVNGVKGYSAMLLFPLLDCVWGFPPDYMHGALLGVTRQIWMEWSKKHLSKSDKEKIDKRLLLLKPPHEIHRLPRSIFDCVKWKASEWRSWMLFYSVLCIQGILRNELFHSYLLFVKSMHTLLTCNISEQDLIECDKNLQIFVLESQKYYGESFMTFNVHSLLHFVESVRISGPLWASSTFPFENGIFLFKQNVNAAKGISYQISVNWLKRYSLHSRIDASSKSIICKEYCYNLFNHRLLTNCVQTENGALVIGMIEPKKNLKNLAQTFFNNNEIRIDVFNRCIFRQTVIHSVAYTRPRKTNNTMILLNSGKIVKVQNLLIVNKKCYIHYYDISIRSINGRDESKIKHIFEIVNESNENIVDIRHFQSKVLVMSVEGKDYVAFFPNTLEIQ